jgi:hypothetical protein
MSPEQPGRVAAMEVRHVDPRDTRWEEDYPTYRVYFFTVPGGVSEEYEIRHAPDVRTVIGWADEQAAGRTYILYALVSSDRPAASGLLTLTGYDPNRPTDPRRPADLT